MEGYCKSIIHYILIMSFKSYFLAATASLLTTSILAMSASGAMAETKNYAGVSLGSWSSTTAFGVNGKFGVAENISVRPFVQFASQSYFGGNYNVTLYGASATYDFNMPGKAELTPYVGLGLIGATSSASVAGFSASASTTSTYFEGGADYTLSDNIVLNANYKSNSTAGGYFSVGAGYNF